MATGRQQLRLVNDGAPAPQLDTRDDVRRVFDHWVWCMGKRQALCKLGPTRRAVISAALAIGYTADQLMCAVEGMAANPLGRVPGDTEADQARVRDAMRELEWFLGRESRIERCVLLGEEVRAEALRDRPADPPQAEQQPVDPAATAAARARLLAIIAERRGVAHG